MLCLFHPEISHPGNSILLGSKSPNESVAFHFLNGSTIQQAKFQKQKTLLNKFYPKISWPWNSKSILLGSKSPNESVMLLRRFSLFKRFNNSTSKVSEAKKHGRSWIKVLLSQVFWFRFNGKSVWKLWLTWAEMRITIFCRRFFQLKTQPSSSDFY